MTRRPSGVYVNTVVPGVSNINNINKELYQRYCSTEIFVNSRAGLPLGRMASKLILEATQTRIMDNQVQRDRRAIFLNPTPAETRDPHNIESVVDL